MSFDKELERAVGEIEIPDSLSPENIGQMLMSANIVQLDPEDIPELLISDKLDRKKIRMSKRSILIRTAAAAAAFAALAIESSCEISFDSLERLMFGSTAKAITPIKIAMIAITMISSTSEKPSLSPAKYF